jgi:hypothetical protein
MNDATECTDPATAAGTGLAVQSSLSLELDQF